jgi:FMN phosphatase YigB (HAD superfamily)
MESEQGFRTVARLSLAQSAIHASYTRLHHCLPTGFNSMGSILRWAKKYHTYAPYSFDVFDTVLRRRVDPPEIIKQLVAENLSERLASHGVHVSPQEIMTQRNKAEETLRQEAKSKGGDAQCFLDDITAATITAIGATSLLRSQDIVDYELRLEKSATEPMPGLRELLAYLQSNGKRVVAVSETYLSLAQIASILEHHGLLHCFDRLYVSSDAGKSKVTGELFRHIIDNEGKQIVHIGDNYSLDRCIPRGLGLKTLWFHSRTEQRRKRQLNRLLHTENKMNYVNAVVGTADETAGPLQKLGYDILGPALTVFVHNAAVMAREQGIQKLFFVARDGFALKKIYQTLQTTVCSDQSFPAATYMCLGRIPVRLASIERFTGAQILEVYPYIARARGMDVSFGDVLKSYGLEPGRFRTLAGRYDLDIDRPVRVPTLESNVLRLLDSGDFQEIVRAEATAAREILREYLLGIGFMGHQKVAVVDANAEGLTQLLLDRIFAEDDDYPQVIRYYFNALNMTAGKAGINLDVPQVKGLVGDWRRDSETDHKLYFVFGMLLELFTHPNHGVTVGYRRRNGRVVPVFRETPQETQYPMTSQGLSGILAYAGDYGARYGLHDIGCEELLRQVRTDVPAWVASPRRSDVMCLANLAATSDWPRESQSSLVKQVLLWDLLTIRGMVNKLNSSLWPQGTLASAPVPGLYPVSNMAATCKNNCLGLVRRLKRK